MNSSECLNIIAQVVYDKKGMNILALDVQGISSITDYFLIAEGSVDRHVKAIAGSIIDKLLELQLKPLHIEGQAGGDWVVIDYGDIVIHIFESSLREKYSLERLWKEGSIVNLTLKTEIPTKE